jgi:hypothetical protein
LRLRGCGRSRLLTYATPDEFSNSLDQVRNWFREFRRRRWLGGQFVLSVRRPRLPSNHRISMGTEERDTVIGGRYLDRLEKRGNEWRIAQRTMLYD